MKTNRLKRLAGGMLLGAALLTAGGAVQAADQKILAGTSCDGLIPASDAGGEGLYHSYSGLQNISSDMGDRYVNCPLIRDNYTNTKGLLELNLAATTNGAAMTCIAISVTQFGSIKQSIAKSSAATGTSVMAFGTSLNQSTSNGSYDVQCTMPYNSQLSSVEYSEPRPRLPRQAPASSGAPRARRRTGASARGTSGTRTGRGALPRRGSCCGFGSTRHFTREHIHPARSSTVDQSRTHRRACLGARRADHP